jgi:hypothetical protein
VSANKEGSLCMSTSKFPLQYIINIIILLDLFIINLFGDINVANIFYKSNQKLTETNTMQHLFWDGGSDAINHVMLSKSIFNIK